MEINVLGQMEVLDGDRRVELGSSKQRALLALLVMHRGQVVSTDRIIDELWGADGGGTDRQNSLWVHISNLRSALEPDRERRSAGTVVLTRSPGYVLGLDGDQVDAHRFERLLTEGRAQSTEHPEAASATLRAALDLWRGRPYEEFTYEPFAQAEIARLDGLRLDALEARIDADLARGADTELVSELEALARRHRLRERFTAQLMLALHRSGRQADALRAYQALRTTLRDEVGADPSTELQDLERRLLVDDPSLSIPRSGRSGPSSGAAVRGYELREEIGRTTTAITHRAYQSSVGREVAFTTILPELADDADFIRRFEADASTVASLEHPDVVPIHDSWREPGAAYLVTRLMRGGSLADLLVHSALSEHECVRMAEAVANALDAAHAAGVVHGDLRAEHILFDEERAAFLSGFGVNDGRALVGAGPTVDVVALADVVAQAMTGMTGTFGQIEGALRPEVAEALRPAADGRSDDASGVARALAAAVGVRSRAVATHTSSTENPYRGLAAFRARDEHVFHGRRRVVERLVNRLARTGTTGRCVAVVGPSGSGKSSVVRAGLVPALARDAVPGSADWFMTGMTPGAHPFEALEEALLRVAVDPPATLLEQLSAGETGLRRAVRRILPDETSELLIVIDQFEEIFTLAPPEVAAGFLDALVGAVSDERGRVRVVATLRADFYDRPLRHHAFGELIREGTEVITPLSTDELDEVITAPAAAVGVEFEPALVTEMVTEVVGRPGALPLLQFALTELFEQRRGNVIGLDRYREIGGVSGALAARAEELYAEGDDLHRDAVRDIFLRLVSLGEGSLDTRRRVLLTELHDLPPGRATVSAVVDRFAGHRLLTLDRDPVTRGPTVEISHEALFTEWRRLAGWIDSARDDVRHQRRLAAALAEWRNAGEADDYLLSSGRLARLETWASATDARLGRGEREFLDRSIAARDRASTEAAEREARRTAAEQRARRRLRFGTAAAVVAVLVTGLAVVAVIQRRSAVESRERLATTARAQELAAASGLELRRDTPLAARLALAAAFTTLDSGEVTPEALDALHWAIQEANLTYPADDTTPVAVRPGQRGPTGVFALPVPDVIRLAQSGAPGQFTAEECGIYFAAGDCIDPMQSVDGDMAIQGGDEAYGITAAGPGSLAGTRVEVISPFGNTDEGFFAELQRFEDQTGIIVTVPSTGDPGFELDRRRADAEPDPDFVGWPQPSHVAEQEPGRLIDVGAYVDVDRLRDDMSPALVAFGTVGPDGRSGAETGELLGIPIDVDLKGLVYYPKPAFEAAGYTIPENYTELVQLSEQIVADGRTPWCHAFGSGLASGWPGTDLLETLVIREGGPELYDAWASHEIPFDHDVVRSAAAKADELLNSPGFARDGATRISQQPFSEQLNHVIAEPPECWLHHQADFMVGTLPTTVEAGVDIDVFPFPPIDETAPFPMLGGGNLLSVFADRPETRAFVHYATSPEWGEVWASKPTSNFVSPNAGFDTSAYESGEVAPGTAVMRRRQGEATREAIASGTWRFDASDLMPPEIGSSTFEGGRGEFWQGMLDVVDGTRTMDQMLADVEAAWQELERRQGPESAG